jgi:FkbM family methyltransferase
MPSPRRLASVLRQRRIPLRTRRDLLLAELRRRLRPKVTYAVSYGPGRVFLSHDDFAIDWESLKFVIADEAYSGDHRGAAVLDIGAHKGYYGAYAIARGARAVVSFEPESANVELLERAAATYRGDGVDWEIRASAVGAEGGEAELHVMSASWGHSLHPPDEFAQYEVGVERVPVEAMARVLEDAGALAAGAPLVVKVNIEGEECGVVLGTPPEAWQAVTELFVEMHPWATCTAEDLAAHLVAAGLSRVPSAMEPVLRLRRAEAPPAGPRSAPS